MVSSSRAFTLVEVLIVISVVAIVAVFVILVLNPVEYLNRSRDSNRAADLEQVNSALQLYSRDNTSGFGSSGVAYLSLVDPSATTTAGTDCSALGFPGGGFTIARRALPFSKMTAQAGFPSTSQKFPKEHHYRHCPSIP